MRARLPSERRSSSCATGTMHTVSAPSRSATSVLNTRAGSSPSAPAASIPYDAAFRSGAYSWTLNGTPALRAAVVAGVSRPAMARASLRGHALGGHAHGRVHGAVAVVAAAALDDLERQPPAEHRRVDVQQLAVRVAVVEDAELAHRRDELRVEVGPSGEVVVVVAGDLERWHAALAHRARDREHVGGRERDVLHAGVAATGQRHVEREAHGPVGGGDRAAANEPVGRGELEALARLEAEHRTVEED